MIHHGDSIEVLRAFSPASIDACVTDPPYELGFMGKRWDASGIAFNPDLWREVLRVLKPGAHLLAFGGTRTYHRMTSAIEDAGFEIRDCLSWLYATGFPKSINLGDGRGTALKPAHEQIVLARRPFKGSVTANVAEHGSGALNVDACRIASESRPNIIGRPKNGDYVGVFREGSHADGETPLGRWPANVLLDESAAALLDEMSGELVDGVAVQRNGGGQRIGSDRTFGGYDGGLVRDDVTYGGRGGASRFYYVAKPSREERDMGCDGLQERQRDDGRKDGAVGGDNPRNRGLQPRGNHHPTVKPVELMRWLVRLVTPLNGTVLDPFMGSGTTGMACVYEQREFIGIEREAEYIAIAERRIRSVAPLFNDGAA